MPDWKSESELATDSLITIKLLHALMGLYGWEFIISLDFDWAILTGKRKFRWPLTFYFAGRYLLLFAIIASLIGFDTPATIELNCQALYVFSEFAGDAAVGLACINLSLRTIAIWSKNKWIIGSLVLIILGHWSLILQGVPVSATWVPGVGCTIVEGDPTITIAIFVYSMCFDFFVLCLTAYKLAWNPRRARSSPLHTKLARMIFADGLVYFIIAFLANLTATIFMILDLNAVMGILFNAPAAVASTIMASWAVRRLYNFDLGTTEVYHSDQQPTSFRGPQPPQVARLTSEPAIIHVGVDTVSEAHPLSDLEAYRIRKPESDSLSSNGDDEQKPPKAL
ncbi:hypothetical protein PAXRUDRAFT_834111 [Paxillus rubicundulus Ve08.2h10]|uniref:Uncharacterized protein n=1 Tax=Paxillus rubicundulus Ve08.2h10 TaxID=930991 RepID=A0A0D0D6Y4_9AGAM|nr:hypothetical protein PAXRUDRAFT_834111 [Paxillus rubicundulus Ve08.2h10]